MYNLIMTDGYSIATEIFDELYEAQEKMQKEYQARMPDELLDWCEESTFIEDTCATLYNNGEDVFQWQIQKIDIPAEPNTPKMVEFKNDYSEMFTSKSEETDVLKCTCIDGFPYDENAQGTIIAKVWLTLHKDIVVNWNDYAYRHHPVVLSLIEEAKREMLEEYETLLKQYNQ